MWQVQTITIPSLPGCNWPCMLSILGLPCMQDGIRALQQSGNQQQATTEGQTAEGAIIEQLQQEAASLKLAQRIQGQCGLSSKELQACVSSSTHIHISA